VGFEGSFQRAEPSSWRPGHRRSRGSLAEAVAERGLVDDVGQLALGQDVGEVDECAGHGGDRDAAVDGEVARVEVAAPASAAFGSQGNPQLGIGNKDTILVVADLIKIYEPPEATDVPASKMPKLVIEKGDPVGFDFSGLPKPKASDDLKRTVLEQGDGETVTPDMTITADYLGQVYKGKKPFDESFSKEPAEFGLSQVVEGWTIGLSGMKVGSRVLLAIPPDLGYGAQEQPNIPANSTLYFVVDIVSAK